MWSLCLSAAEIDLIMSNDSLRALTEGNDYLVYSEGDEEIRYIIIINHDSCYVRVAGEATGDVSRFEVRDTLPESPILRWAFGSMTAMAQKLTPEHKDKFIVNSRTSLYGPDGKLLFNHENDAPFRGPGETEFNDYLHALNYFLLISNCHPIMRQEYVNTAIWVNDYKLTRQTNADLKQFLHRFDPTDSVYSLVSGREFIMQYSGHDKWKYSIVANCDSSLTLIYGKVGGDFNIESASKGYPILIWGLERLPELAGYISSVDTDVYTSIEIILSIYAPDGRQLLWQKNNCDYSGPQKEKFEKNYNRLGGFMWWLILKEYTSDWVPDIRVVD